MFKAFQRVKQNSKEKDLKRSSSEVISVFYNGSDISNSVTGTFSEPRLSSFSFYVLRSGRAQRSSLSKRSLAPIWWSQPVAWLTQVGSAHLCSCLNRLVFSVGEHLHCRKVQPRPGALIQSSNGLTYSYFINVI